VVGSCIVLGAGTLIVSYASVFPLCPGVRQAAPDARVTFRMGLPVQDFGCCVTLVWEIVIKVESYTIVLFLLITCRAEFHRMHEQGSFRLLRTRVRDPARSTSTIRIGKFADQLTSSD
jgi:hypothetical protein